MMSIEGHPLAVDPTRPGLVENLPRRSPFPDRMVLFYDPGEPVNMFAAGKGGGRPFIAKVRIRGARSLRVDAPPTYSPGEAEAMRQKSEAAMRKAQAGGGGTPDMTRYFHEHGDTMPKLVLAKPSGTTTSGEDEDSQMPLFEFEDDEEGEDDE